MTPEERTFLERARVGSLATADGAGHPHAVPICFAFLEREGDEDDVGDQTEDDPRIVSAIDEKPKSTTDLQRVRDVRENPSVTLLVDRYREDWSRLAWVQVRGRARVVSSDYRGTESGGEHQDGHERAVNALRTKYDQYAGHALEERPILVIRVGRTLSWGALESDPVDAHEYDVRGT